MTLDKAIFAAFALSLAFAAPARGDGATDSFARTLVLAEKGDAEAQLKLGVMYDTGLGAPQNHAQAVKWYRLAADKGKTEAQFNLGFLYSMGQGVPRNYIEAHMWLSLAAPRGHAIAAHNRETLATFMTPAQIDEADKLASEWKPVAAE